MQSMISRNVEQEISGRQGRGDMRLGKQIGWKLAKGLAVWLEDVE